MLALDSTLGGPARAVALLLLALGLVACGGRVHLGTDDGGAGPTDAGPRPDAEPPIDAGPPPGEPCGPVVCGAGTECCNASCGICTPPGVGCIALACERTCATGADCLGGEYCAYEDQCPGSGGAMNGVCIPRPEECDSSLAEVCGCDGETYSNSCAAGRAGVNVASEGRCGGARCAPQDINGEGPCPAFFGTYWDGAQCVAAGGCGCTGADCDDIYELSPEGERRCYAEHSGCTSCAAMSAAGIGACDAELGVSWDGAACGSISGCECVGADCGRLYPSTSACESAHAHCGAGCVSDADCAPGGGEFCRFPEGICPGEGAPGTCEPITGERACTLEQPPVCGCDGQTYGCGDDAWGQGANVRFDGGCPSTGACAAFDAVGDGDCFALLGVKWNGARCESVGGCECVGPDCARLYGTESECAAAHAGCERPAGGTCGGEAGETCRPDEFCDFPEAMTECGGDDGLGACAPRPEGCTDEVAPVCACDNRVYSNACEAMAAGFDVRNPDPGACPAP